MEVGEKIIAQKERLQLASIDFSDEALRQYLAADDILTEGTKDYPEGYKRCGRCERVMKLYLFNKNKASKLCCTGNCKECQKEASRQSYEKTKCREKHKENYYKNREARLEQNRKYYQENKEARRIAHRNYKMSKAGKQTMKRAHEKRRMLMETNAGIPYKREWIVERDTMGGEHPICYLCGKLIQFDRDIQLDHVIPIALGGPDCFTNIACTHKLCNLTKKKDARDIEAEHVEEILGRAEKYMKDHEELFNEQKEE